jgi:RHS repeat-associated protein
LTTSAGNLDVKNDLDLEYEDANHVHAVTHIGSTQKYWYDENGNQVTRIYGADTYNLLYDAENRMTEVKKNNVTMAQFTYNGDGQRVKSVIGSETILFVNGYYEKKGSEITKYYFAGAGRIAVRKYTVPETNTLTYLLGDHLGSTSLAVDASTGAVVETRYKPWGEVRFTTASATLPTRYTFTGQYSYVSDSATDLAASTSFGLMYYNARWYDPMTGRMAQADTIVPGGVQGLDRYAYVNNSPVRYTDPSGHVPCEDSFSEYECHLLQLGYSTAEAIILSDMYARGGITGRNAVNYMVQHDVHLYVEDYGTSTGAKWTIGNNIIINSNNTDFDSLSDVITSGYYQSVVGLIAHEAKHLEQGLDVALSVYGEFEGWKTEEQLEYEMFGTVPRFGSTRDIVLRTPLTHDPNILGWIWRAMVGEQGFDYKVWLLPLNPFEPFTNPWVPAILAPY